MSQQIIEESFQEQVVETPVTYQSSSTVLTQRLEKIRAGVPQEQVTQQKQIAIQASTVLNQRLAKTSEISQVQVSQIPTYQTSGLLPRLQMSQETQQEQVSQMYQSTGAPQMQESNRGPSQVQVSQIPSTYQSSTGAPQRLERNQGPSQARVSPGSSNLQSSTGSTGVSHQPERERYQGMPQDQPSGVHCNQPSSAEAACSSGLGGNRRQSYDRNCAPETSSSSLCCCCPSSLCGSLCGCLCGSASKCLAALLGLISFVWLGLAIAQIVIGSVFLDNCPRQRYIPIYLIVSGVTVVVMCLLSVVAALRPNKIIHSLLAILGLFWFAWLIAGSVWTFSLYPIYTTIDCNRVVYLFTFAILIIQWIMIALSLPAIFAKLRSICSSCTSCSSCSMCSRCLACCSCMTKN